MGTKITSDNIDATIATAADLQKNEFNISLLGFKMAVNDGLTVYNLVDGVVDEFHDESGTDEAEGSNDTYCGTNDNYTNVILGSPVAYSAGFSISSITEPDTSTAGANPTQGTATAGEFTVPNGLTQLTAKLWGAGGGGGDHGGNGTSCEAVGGGGGGYVEAEMTVTGGQTLDVYVGEGGKSTPAPVATGGAFGGGNGNTGQGTSGGGGFSAIMAGGASYSEGQSNPAPGLTPSIYLIAGAGGGGGGHFSGGIHPAFGGFDTRYDGDYAFGGRGGGLTGWVGGNSAQQTSATSKSSGNLQGGGGSQSAGGQGAACSTQTSPGGFLYGGSVDGGDANRGAGGGGFYGGGGGGHGGTPASGYRGGGGGSSYYGNPNVSGGFTATTWSGDATGNGAAVGYPGAPSTEVGDGVRNTPTSGTVGNDGYVLLTGTATPSTITSTTIVSDSFTSSSVATSSRIVVFEEDVDTPTLNTDIIASISRDGGTTYTTATLSDSGYVTGTSGQRILTGQATVSGQPSGQSMRWKLQLANNITKIHGVSLQWS